LPQRSTKIDDLRAGLPVPGIRGFARRDADGPLDAPSVLIELKIKTARCRADRLAIDRRRAGIRHSILFKHRDEMPF
jgi:hypothetical protein